MICYHCELYFVVFDINLTTSGFKRILLLSFHKILRLKKNPLYVKKITEKRFIWNEILKLIIRT